MLSCLSSCRVFSSRVVHCLLFPCLALSCLASPWPPCPVLVWLVLPFLVLVCLGLACLTLLRLVLACLVLFCLALLSLDLFCLVLSCLVLFCLSCLVLSCLVSLCLVLSCPVLSCLALSCLVLFCLALPCLVLSCPAVHCLFFSCLIVACLTHVQASSLSLSLYSMASEPPKWGEILCIYQNLSCPVLSICIFLCLDCLFPDPLTLAEPSLRHRMSRSLTLPYLCTVSCTCIRSCLVLFLMCFVLSCLAFVISCLSFVFSCLSVGTKSVLCCARPSFNVGLQNMPDASGVLLKTNEISSLFPQGHRGQRKEGNRGLTYRVAVRGDTAHLREILAECLQCGNSTIVDERNPANGRTILHEACAFGHTDMVKMLLKEYNADANKTTFLGKTTALHIASSRGHRKICFYLLVSGADVHAKDKYGATPLHTVNRVDVAKTLVQYGALSSVRDNSGRSPIVFVLGLEGEHSKLIRFLEKAAESEERDKCKAETNRLKEEKAEHKRLEDEKAKVDDDGWMDERSPRDQDRTMGEIFIFRPTGRHYFRPKMRRQYLKHQ